MKLYEYQGKALFKQAKIPIPKSTLITKPKILDNVILKAQVLKGGRGKAGLIKKVTKANSKAISRRLLKKCKVILAEEILDIKQEHYLSIMVDRTTNQYRLIYSSKGGIDIEQVDKKNIKQYTFTNKLPNIPKKFKPIADKLFRLVKDKDLILAEINPLIETKNKLIAADAKVVTDDNALFRQPKFRLEFQKRQSKEEQKASKLDIHYVKLDGNIGVIGNGAGLVMTTMDLLSNKNLKPSDFLDVKGGASEKSMRGALQLIQKQKPKALFINIFGGITHCDYIAKAITKWKIKTKTKIPIVVRMIGTNEKEAELILKKAKITPVRSLEKGITALRRLL